jgi:hypothetical protein
MSDVTISIGTTGKEVTIHAFKEVSASAKELGDALMEHTKKLGELFLGYESIVKTLEVFKSAIEKAGDLGEVSEQTGVQVRQLVLLQRAFADAGMKAEDVAPAFAKMSKFLEGLAGGGDKAAEKLAPMGLTLAELEGLQPEQLFEKLAKGISNIEDPTARSAVAMEAFGRSGFRMLALLKDVPGALEEAEKGVGSYATTVADHVEDFKAVKDAFNEISNKAVEFATGALAPVIGSFKDLTEVLKNLDATNYGKEFFDSWSDSIKAIAEALAHGKFHEAFQIIFDDAVLYAMKTADQVLRIASALKNGILSTFSELFSEDAPFVKQLEGIFSYLGLYFTKVITEGLAHLFEKIPLMGETAAALMEEVKGRATRKETIDDYASGPNGIQYRTGSHEQITPGIKGLDEELKDVGENLRENWGAAGKNLVDSIAKGTNVFLDAYAKNGPIIDVSAQQARINAESNALLKKFGKDEETERTNKGFATLMDMLHPDSAAKKGFGSTILSGNQMLPLDQFNLNTGLYKNTGTLSLDDQAVLQAASNANTMSPFAAAAQARASQQEKLGNYIGASSIRAQESKRLQSEALAGLKQFTERGILGGKSKGDYLYEHRMSEEDFEKQVSKTMGPVDSKTGQRIGPDGKPIGADGKPIESDPMEAILKLIESHLPKIDTSTAAFAVLT